MQFLKTHIGMKIYSLHVEELVVYDIPEEGCNVLKTVMLQAIELNNTGAIELLSMIMCGLKIVSKIQI